MRKTPIIFTVVLLLMALSLLSVIYSSETFVSSSGESPSFISNSISSSTPCMEIHVIDVGQGDSILFRYNDTSILIDGGTANAGPTVIEYLKNEGISSLDYVIATHPHEDHIGGLLYIIDSFSVGMYVDNNVVHNTASYRNVMTLVDLKNIPVRAVERGDSFPISPNVSISVLSPSVYTGDLNEDSVILKASYDDIDVLMMGDAGIDAESTLMVYEHLASSSSMSLKDIEVLKVGHHGSRTASGTSFISYVDPDVAIISVGKNNQYGHPHSITMDTLTSFGINIYRTDQDGSVIVRTDGIGYEITTIK